MNHAETGASRHSEHFTAQLFQGDVKDKERIIMRRTCRLTSDVVVDIVLATLAAFLCVVIDYTNRNKEVDAGNFEDMEGTGDLL